MPANIVRTPAEEKKRESSLRIVARFLLKRAYEAGHIEPVGWGWVPGEVEENTFHGEGSVFPPLRDGKGLSLGKMDPVETSGLTPMLSKNKAPKTA